MKEIRRRAPTTVEAARLKKAMAEESRPEVVAENREQIRLYLAAQHQSGSIAQRVIQLLKRRKDEQLLTLIDLQERTGINSGNLSRLLNSDEPNVTLETVERIADALGCRVLVSLSEK